MGPEEPPAIDLVEHERLIADARRLIKEMDERLAAGDEPTST